MSKAYRPVADGEWIPIRHGYRLECCDCALVHRVDLRMRAGRVQLRAFRDQRATGQIRRHSKIVVTGLA